MRRHGSRRSTRHPNGISIPGSAPTAKRRPSSGCDHRHGLLGAPRIHRAEPAIMSDIKKVVLAYSGGLDTSVILKWLQVTYGCEVVTFTADLGQGEELE